MINISLDSLTENARVCGRVQRAVTWPATTANESCLETLCKSGRGINEIEDAANWILEDADKFAKGIE